MPKYDMADHQHLQSATQTIPSAKPGDIALTGELEAAITHAYAVFEPYGERFTAQVCLCPSCFAEADRDRLLKLPLRQIDGGLLDQYSWSAHGHDDDGPCSDDLRYLLPRYFELFALNDAALHNTPECNLTQLGQTAYRADWPAGEVAAIDRYFDALLLACLANKAIDLNYSSNAKILTALDTALERRVSGLRHALWLEMGLSLVGIMLAMYLLVAAEQFTVLMMAL